MAQDSLQWSILVSLYSECDEEIVVDSCLKKLEQNTHFYAWTDPLNLDGFDMDLYLSFQLVLGCGRLEVLRITIPKEKLRIKSYMTRKMEIHRTLNGRRKSIYGSIEPLDEEKDVMIMNDGMVQINYASHRYRQTQYQIRIYMVSITLHIDLVNKILYQRGHKIGCFIGCSSQDLETYLGRPQRIRTFKTTRQFHWLSATKEERNFGNLSPRSNLDFVADEGKDLILIRTAMKNKAEALISTRRIQHDANVVWDNDAFCNPNKRLPIKVRNMTITFYNFKTIPPRCVRSVITWGRFTSAYLSHINYVGKLQKSEIHKRYLLENPEEMKIHATISHTIVPGISVWIQFYMDKKHQMAEITEVHLTANDYDDSLDFSCLQLIKS